MIFEGQSERFFFSLSLSRYLLQYLYFSFDPLSGISFAGDAVLLLLINK